MIVSVIVIVIVVVAPFPVETGGCGAFREFEARATAGHGAWPAVWMLPSQGPLLGFQRSLCS